MGSARISTGDQTLDLQRDALATGLGDRVHLADPAIDLDVSITDIVNLLEFEELDDVILVGWSHGCGEAPRGLRFVNGADNAPKVSSLMAQVSGQGEDGGLAYCSALSTSMPTNGWRPSTQASCPGGMV
jgi:hypothetical protein